MIVSVPHSGTRTLCEHIGESAHLHFGMNDAEIERFEGHIDIPVRDPFDVSVSWLARYPSEDYKDQAYVNDLLDRMIAYSERPDLTYWKIEDLPRLKGRSPGDKIGQARAEFVRTRLSALKRWIVDNLDFYRSFNYELEWL